MKLSETCYKEALLGIHSVANFLANILCGIFLNE